MEPAWLTEARKYTNIREVKGINHNPIIVGFWKIIGLAGIRDDETPWCAAFVGACLKSVGIEAPKSGWAKAYLNWGKPLRRPVVGCVAVLSRQGGGGHVFFVTGQDENGNPVGIGGNQSDAVNVKAFDQTRVLGYRWPASVPVADSQLPTVSAADLSRNEA